MCETVIQEETMKKVVIMIAVLCTLFVSMHLCARGISSTKDYRTNHSITATVTKAHNRYKRHSQYYTLLLDRLKKPVRNADAFEQCAVAVFSRGESTVLLYECALEIGDAEEDPELYTKGVAWALNTDRIAVLRQLVRQYNGGTRTRQDLLAVFAQKTAPETAYTHETKEHLLEQAKTAQAAEETKRRAAYMTAFKQLINKANAVSNKAVIEQCMEEAKTADVIQTSNLYQYARHIGTMQNDKELYTQGLHLLLQGESAAHIISIIEQYRKNTLDRSEVLQALEN